MKFPENWFGKSALIDSTRPNTSRSQVNRELQKATSLLPEIKAQEDAKALVRTNEELKSYASLVDHETRRKQKIADIFDDIETMDDSENHRGAKPLNPDDFRHATTPMEARQASLQKHAAQKKQEYLQGYADTVAPFIDDAFEKMQKHTSNGPSAALLAERAQKQEDFTSRTTIKDSLHEHGITTEQFQAGIENLRAIQTGRAETAREQSIFGRLKSGVTDMGDTLKGWWKNLGTKPEMKKFEMAKIQYTPPETIKTAPAKIEEIIDSPGEAIINEEPTPDNIVHIEDHRERAHMSDEEEDEIIANMEKQMREIQAKQEREKRQHEDSGSAALDAAE